MKNIYSSNFIINKELSFQEVVIGVVYVFKCHSQDDIFRFVLTDKNGTKESHVLEFDQNSTIEKLKDKLKKDNIDIDGQDTTFSISISNEVVVEKADYPLNVYLSALSGNVQLTIVYDDIQYQTKMMPYIATHIEKVLNQLCASMDDFESIYDISLCTDEENSLLYSKKIETINYSESNIVDVIEKIADLYGERVAAVEGDKQILYEDLVKEVKLLSGKLIALGVQKGDYVVVQAAHTIDVLALMISLMRINAVYVPVSETIVDARFQYIVNDCGAKFVIADKDYKRLFGSALISWENLFEQEVPNELELNIKASVDDIAYAIYTSGSTGNPKGVMVKHRGLLNLKEYFEYTVGVTYEDVISQFFDLSFDGSVWEIMMSVLSGACLCFTNEEQRKSTDKFEEFARKNNITIAALPPLFYEQIKTLNTRILITAGSAASKLCVEKALNAGVRYINSYGPTEGTIASTHWEISEGDIPEIIPIGKAIHGAKVYILRDKCLAGIGEIGEICIAGENITKGYINNPTMTDEKYVTCIDGHGIMYKTGDLGKFDTDGNVIFVGRVDSQVKVRGYRVELSEIEHALEKENEIKKAVVDVVDGNQLIYAYIVYSDSNFDEIGIKNNIAKNIPNYMVPNRIFNVDYIPQTERGKINFSKLYEWATESFTEAVIDDPETELEEDICDIWKDVLSIDRIGVNEDFFDLGGHSLLANKILTRVNDLCGCDISILDFFVKGNTVRKLSELVEETLLSELTDEELQALLTEE